MCLHGGMSREGGESYACMGGGAAMSCESYTHMHA